MTNERGGRYFREARFFLAGDKDAAQSYVIEARSMMGYMRDMQALGGPPIQVKYATLLDGTQIKATMMNGQYQAEIFSPMLGEEKRPEVYEIWVRPYWTETEDWDLLVKLGGNCSATTVIQERKFYSNRIWKAKDGSLYCIIGGNDENKYIGELGNIISKDGDIILQDADFIAGVAEFQGKLVIVRRITSYTYCYPGSMDINSYMRYVGVGGVEGQIASKNTICCKTISYEVLVDGQSKLIIPKIDSKIDGGFAVADGQIQFSQDIVVFNSDGSEGACVLGDTKVLKFHLTIDDGIVSVNYTIDTIPNTTTTSPLVWSDGVTGVFTSSEEFNEEKSYLYDPHSSAPILMSRSSSETRNRTEHIDVHFKPENLRRAVLCDYDDKDYLVYCIVEEEYSSISSSDTYIMETEFGEYTKNNNDAVDPGFQKNIDNHREYNKHFSGVRNAGVKVIVSFECGAAGNKIICETTRGRVSGESTSTGEWSSNYFYSLTFTPPDNNGVEIRRSSGAGGGSESRNFIYEGMITHIDNEHVASFVPYAPILLAVDLKYGFAIYTISGEMQETVTIADTADGTAIIEPTVAADNAIRTESIHVSTLSPRKIAAKFADGIEHILHVYPEEDFSINLSGPVSSDVHSHFWWPNGTVNTQPQTFIHTLYEIIRCNSLDYPQVYEPQAVGFVVPDNDGNWSRALAFVGYGSKHVVPDTDKSNISKVYANLEPDTDAFPKAFSICKRNINNITSEFEIENVPLESGGVITRHFGVIHTEGKTDAS